MSPSRARASRRSRPLSPARVSVAPHMLDALGGLIAERTGWRADPRHHDALLEAIGERVRSTGAAGFAAYYERLAAGTDDECLALAQLLTVGESYFMRVPQFFAAFAQHLLPELIARKQQAGAAKLSIWSAACSTGEEPYSIAICLRNLGLDLDGWRVQILGTDLNAAALERAKRGVFSAWSFRVVEQDRHDVWRHVSRTGSGLYVDAAIKRMVTFAPFNLADEGYPRPADGAAWDMIFLRNVLMYMTVTAARKAMDRAAEVLSADGMLFVGECEAVAPLLPDQLELQRLGQVFFCRRTPPRQRAGARAAQRAVPGAAAQTIVAHRERMPSGSARPVRRRATSRVTPAVRANRLYGIALTAFHEEQLDVARDALLSALELNPQHIEGRLLWGNVLAGSGQFADAREQAERVLSLDPLEARAYLLLGIISHAQGTAPAALANLRNALYLAPDLPVAHFFLARVHQQIGEHALSSRHYRQALDRIERTPAERLELGFSRRALLEASQRCLGTSRSRRVRT